MARRNTVPYSERVLEGDPYDKRMGPVQDAKGAVMVEDRVASSRSVNSEAFLFPTSFAQQRLWFFEQLYPGSPVYHLSTVLPFDGPLDCRALEDSLCDLLDRHESLRTTFTALDGVPVQLIAPSLRIDLPLADVSQPAGGCLERARAAVRAALAAPFDLVRGPLLRASLLRLETDYHWLVLVFHHIVADGWSLEILHRDLRALYAGRMSGEPPLLPALPIQYADFACWQRRTLQGERLNALFTYWQKQLEDAPVQLSLPTDRPRPAQSSYRGGRCGVWLNASLTARLRALGQAQGATLFMTLLAAFGALLSRYSGQSDLVIGTPIANRTRSELEGLIGFFVNTLALRLDLSGDPSFAGLLERVRTVAAEAYAHQDMPFEMLVARLAPARHLSQAPLFQVMFALQNVPSGEKEETEMEEVSAPANRNREESTAKFDLLLSLVDDGHRVTGYFEYSADLFDSGTINRMAGHFEVLLAAAAADPACRFSSLPILTEAERGQLLFEWNATRTEYPRESCIHDLFEEQAAACPEAVALVLQDCPLTYGELNARANQLAHRLRELGVGPETVVAICVERSFDLIVGLLGILKAGGAYLAMDPGDPPSRLSAMVRDAKPAVLLTHRRFLGMFPEEIVKRVCLDDAREEIECEPTDNPVSGVVANNLAYVCYTSGSTGVPKGVGVVQHAVVRLIREAGYATFIPEDVFLQFAPIAFDASTFEIWACLLNGGKLVIMPPTVPSLEELADVIEHHRISTLWLTIGLFHQMVDGHCECLGGVRQLLTGGDVLSPDYIRKMREQHPQCLLIAAYGPTENTTFTSCYRVPSAEKIHSPIPIGRPIANTEMYVLDDRLQPVPIGVPGELYIGGEGLARGYLNRPELTAERFVPHPFRAGARVYRTGDWVRYLPDANLEFLGRRDQQVKVRGFRVELGEVEAALRGYPGVREAVATVREDAPGDKRLVAYVVADKSPAASEWRRFLQARLPDYMVPSAFMDLPALPLTANGKIDRSALPVPTVAREAETVVPRTEDEQRLAEIFAQVLRLDQVGIHDNFFELGGHSLLATQAISRIRDVLHAAVPLHVLFGAPTVAELALRLGPRSILQPIPRRSREQESSPLSFAQQRLWFLDQLTPQSTAYNLCTTFSFTGPLNTAALEKSLGEIVRRHEILRTTFTAIDGQGTQVIMPPSPPAFTMMDLRHAPVGEARRVANSDAATPFDLARGPLLRATLMRTGESDHVLVLTMHHIVADGWSLGILQRELDILLEAYSDGRLSPLPELPIQYADFACWQRRLLQGERLDSLFAYWQKQLEDAPAQLLLPTGRPRPAVQTFQGASLSATLPPALAEGLRALSQREGATLFMMLLAAFGVLLSRYSGQSDLVIGTPIANRTRSELEGLIGFFVNTLALRLDLSGDPSFVALLERVRTVATGAYTHQELPFEVLVSRLAPARHLSHTPLFQVMFALENHAEETLPPASSRTVGDRAMGDVMEARGAAKFDLTLAIAEFNDGITATFEYATDLFDSAAIRQMLDHFVVLLEGAIASPEQRISELPLLSRRERQQLLVEWNATEAAFPRDRCIHALFELQAARTPEAIALETVDERLTYAQLNQQADQLAARLRGFSADTPIGLLTDRGTGLAVGALGILKAGAAYVPIDATFPEERIAFILSDTAAPAVVTRSVFTDRLSGCSGRVICMDTAAPEETGNASAGGVAASIAPDGLAYIVYTSGSTGLPKGVMVSHRALVNHATAVSGAYELCATDRILQIASPAFDVAAEEIFPPWLCGATVVVWPDVGPPVFSDLLDFVESRRLSILNLPASYWHGWVAELATLRLPKSLRLVVAGSEPMIAARLSDWMRHTHGQIRLINAYGPSETTITAALCKIARFEVPADSTIPVSVSSAASVLSVPIGRPIANTEMYVLDDRLQPVPIGVPGELYIGGEGLARGYLNRPELTAERFVPHPFRAGARVYRTGDWVRYLPDANLEFLGRRDQQVKVRGFRVELGEVEAALRGYPGVREAVATVREDAPGDKRLVAYVVADKSPAASEWRRFLQARLPDYMVPSAFMDLPALPLTANGKIDRSALPVPTVAREAETVVPRTEDEQRLAEIFAQVLRLDQVGIHDNFFELGGDSILAIQIVARARSKGLRFTPRQLFEQPTVAGLLIVANTGSIAAEQGIVTGTAPLTPIQHWFFEQELADPQHYNQSVLLAVSRDIDDDRWRRVFDQLLAHHDALRLRFFRTGDGWLQTLAAPDAATPYRRIDLSGIARSRRMAAVAEQAAQVQASLDLSRGPLLRAALFDFGPDEEASLLIVIHHLAVDGVSWRILLEDLDAANARMEHIAALPPKTTAFTSWAGKLAAYANSADLMEEAGYWLAALPMQAAPLPRDLPTPLEANTAGSSRTVAVSLATEETARLLRDIARTHRARIDEILLTAVALALARWTGVGETLVDVEGHGRETISDDVDLSRTVGWFTTIFPVALDVGDCANPGAALRRTKEKLRAIPRRGIGYGLLRYMSKSDAGDHLKTLPQAQMSFNYLGQFEHSADPGADGNDPRGAAFSERDRRRYLIDINGGVFSDRLHLSWIYSEAIHHRATIETLAAAFLEELRGIITYNPSSGDMGFSPADFPLSSLDQAQLDQLLRDNPDLDDIYPLSPMQEGMLFHTLLDPDAGIYVEQLLHSFSSDIDIEAFEQGWRCVVMRHPALRTTFHWKGLDAPLQVVHREAQLDCVHLDWRESSQPKQRLDDFLDADRKRGFDLAKAPPMRIFLIRTGENQFEFIWSHHHALLDGWSVPILFAEVGDFYDAIQRGIRHEPPPPRPYRDYIAWLREQDRNAAQAYWKHALQGFFAATPLVVERPHTGAAESGEHGEQYIRMSAGSTATLETFARTHQLTLNTLIQAAWAVLLSRYSGETDIVFGVIVSGRPAAIAGVESMLGLFINALPLRVSVAEDVTLLDWLQDLQARQLKDREYEYSSLAEVQRLSEIPPGQPLFESLLVFQNYPRRGTAKESKAASATRAVERTSYPLTAIAAPGEELLLRFLYDRAHFDDAIIMRMLDHWRTLLEAIAANSAGRLANLSLLTAAERRQLTDWNHTQHEYPSDRCIHELFLEQTVRTPDAVALVHGTTRFTYREISERADMIASHLRRLGVHPDTPVALCLERSPEMVSAVLAVLIAGGACVPLDPAYPRERLTFMLQDSGALLLLTQRALLERLPAYRALCLDEPLPPLPGNPPPIVPKSMPKPENLAYIIYTSGSTGKPKGVALPHRTLVNLTAWQHGELGPGGNTLQFAPLSFDVSFQEIFSTLCAGATLVLAPETLRQDPVGLWRLIGEQQVDRLYLPFVALQQLAEAAIHIEPLPATLREIITAGEQLQVTPQIRNLFGNLPGCRLHNHYGPSETHVVTAYTLAGSPNGWPLLPPIGHPIANTCIHLLDPGQRLVPIGVPGEIYIGGDNLARGYLNRDELTAEKFIAHPDYPDSRLYRTGDLARYLPDGEIEFLGRLDHQVKIRGFRVEPGEVEAVLASYPAVHEAVVLVREDEPGDRRLAAYVVARTETPPTAGDLRRFLLERLPEYLVPSAYVFLVSFPLTPSGKIDRRALPAPDHSRPDLGRAAILPRTDDETRIAQIWAQVLGLDAVGVEDNFFELGGHSLLATRVISRIRDTFRIEVPLRRLFEFPTVAGLARAIGRETGEATAEPAILAGLRTDPCPLSFAQQRLWFFEQLYPGSPVYHLSTVLPFDGPLDCRALEDSLCDLLDRHESLRTTFTALDGVPVQLIAPSLRIDLPLADVSQPAGGCLERARAAVRAALAAPFDLVRGPLLRASLLRLETDYHWLVLVFHHIVADGWSLEILHRDLRALYAGRMSGEPPLLPALPIQYADFACWQRRTLQGERLNALFTYWQKQLEDAPVQLSLPTDRPRPAQSSYRGGRCGVWLNASLTARLRALGQAQGATLFMTLLAAFGALLSRYSGQSDLVIGTPIANRTRSELEGLIGFFVNTLALRLDLSGDPSFAGLLERVRTVAAEAYAHQDMPFEMLVARLAPARHLSQAPLFQVMFNLLNIDGRISGDVAQPPDAEPDEPTEPEGSEESAKFDLTLYAMEYDRTIRLHAVYARDLFESGTVARILGHFTTLLEMIVTRPDIPLLHLRLTHEMPSGKNMVAPMTPFSEFPEQALDRSIGSRFHEQAERYPDRVAIRIKNEQWTYKWLEALSNRIANAVLSLCGESGARIALSFHHDASMIAAMLGVLKAGKTYVPLDRAHPPARTERIIGSSGAAAVLTDIDGFSTEHAQVIRLGETERFEANPPPLVSPGAVAYILYTSGSTGEPKGVVQTHRNVLGHVRAYTNNLHLCADDRLTFVSSYGVDAAVQDIFGALLNGAAVYPVSVRENGVQALADCLVEQEITVLHCAPTLFRHLMHAFPTAPPGSPPELARLKRIRLVALGGEAVYRRDVDLFRAHFPPDCLLVNGFGLTESTMALQYFIDGGTTLVRDAVPIGYPVDGVELLLLDDAGEPADVYCPGEIVLRGPSIAMGYWRQGEIAPFPSDAGGRRLYRTGDLGRRLPDGSIEFIGRRDFQVKIRGYRIEPGEIEKQLLEYPGVRQAVVIPQAHAGSHRLVAYVSAKPEQAPAPDGLKRYLECRLPDYLVPPVFVVLEELPTTSSGKINRLALPAPQTSDDNFAPPHTAAEIKLAAIWRQVLATEHIGIHDNFFTVGGHSLFATQIISRLRDEFGIELPLQQIFETPTIAGLALAVAAAQAESTPLPKIEPLPRWRHRAMVSPFGELVFSKDLRAMLDRFAAAGGTIETPF